MLNKEVETKYTTSVTNQNSFKCIVGSSTYTPHIQLDPIIKQGTDTHQRIGDKVKITKSIAHVIVQANPYSAVENNVYLPTKYIFWLISCKRTQTTVFNDTNIVSRLFQSVGEGTNGCEVRGFTGNYLIDDTAKINSDEFIVHKKWHGTTKIVEETTQEHTHHEFVNYQFRFNVNVGKYLKGQQSVGVDDDTGRIKNKNLWLVGFAYYEGGYASDRQHQLYGK